MVYSDELFVERKLLIELSAILNKTKHPNMSKIRWRESGKEDRCLAVNKMLWLVKQSTLLLQKNCLNKQKKNTKKRNFHMQKKKR